MRTAPVKKWSHIELLATMIQNVLTDGTRRVAEHAREHIIQLEIGNGETVQGAVLFTGKHIGEFCAIAHQVTKLADIGWQDKTGLGHTAHI